MCKSVFFLLWATSVATSEDFAFYFTEEPSSSFAKLGDRVMLKCSTNVPAIRITWHFNDVTLTSDSDSNRRRRKRNKEDRGPVDWRIRNLQTHDSGHNYRANNVVRFSDPKSTGRRKERKRSERRRKDVLHFGNRYVRSDTRARSENAKTRGIQLRGGRLIVLSFAAEDEGSYFCVAATADGSIRSLAANVQLAYISNFAITPPKRLTATSAAVVIPCDLPKSLPPAQPRWEVDGQAWSEPSSAFGEVLPSGNLLIRNASSFDGFEFRCAAHNAITDETVTALGSTILSVEQEFHDENRFDVVYPTSNETVNFTVAAGSRILLECVTGNLANSIWARDNGPIPVAATITEAGLNMTASVTDEGQYTCKSSGSSRTISYNVSVQDKPRVESVSPSHVTSPIDGVVALKCALRSVSKVDHSWRWYYNGEVIDDATYSNFNVSGRFGYLPGFYQCFAQSETGSWYAVFQLESKEAYFELKAAPDKVATPQIETASAPTLPDSHTLRWATTDTDVRLFSVKFYKEPRIDSSGNVVRYPSRVVNVPGHRRQTVLSGLDPSSHYTVEIVSVGNAGTRSDMAISSFGTGRARETRATTLAPPKSEKKKDSGVREPRAPSKPVVNGISTKQISLMWSPRGNGGSPIIGYKIQRKELDSKDGWLTIGETKTFPAEVGNLQRGRAYKFRVIAYNAVGDSKPSSPSKSYPKPTKPKRLTVPPYITKAIAQGVSSIFIEWHYEDVPLSFVLGYYMYYRLTDSDNEEDYKREAFPNPTATSYVIRDLQPGMQYDIKIAAFNDVGRSPYSNVIILEMPKINGPDGDPFIDKTEPTGQNPDEPDRNDPARDKANQRNATFLITGAVIGAILVVLLVTVFCYWRKRGVRNAKSSPEAKRKNGNTAGYNEGKPCDHIDMSAIGSNAHPTPHGAESPGDPFGLSPHDTRCRCSRHHSNHSSLGRKAEHPRYVLGWGAGDYPNIHSNPMHVYMDAAGHHYFPPHGIGNWVRSNNGEFCHIIPLDASKMNGDGAPEAVGRYFLPGGQMVTRTYDGNMTSADNSVRRPDHGYHSNEDGARTGSDSSADKSDNANLGDEDDGNSTSGVVTLNDVTIESRPESPTSGESAPATSENDSNENINTNRGDSLRKTAAAAGGDESPKIGEESSLPDESAPFLSAEDSTHREVSALT